METLLQTSHDHLLSFECVGMYDDSIVLFRIFLMLSILFQIDFPLKRSISVHICNRNQQQGPFERSVPYCVCGEKQLSASAQQRSHISLLIFSTAPANTRQYTFNLCFTRERCRRVNNIHVNMAHAPQLAVLKIVFFYFGLRICLHLVSSMNPYIMR